MYVYMNVMCTHDMCVHIHEDVPGYLYYCCLLCRKSLYKKVIYLFEFNLVQPHTHTAHSLLHTRTHTWST
jgi:hypothetical protein